MKNALTILLIVLIALPGCSPNVALNPNIVINSYSDQQYTGAVGVIISDDLKKLVEFSDCNTISDDEEDDDSELPDGSIGEKLLYMLFYIFVISFFKVMLTPSYKYKIGKQLSPVLLESTKAVYDNVVEMNNEDTYDLDRVIMFSLIGSDVELTRDRYATKEYITDFNITIGIDIFDAQNVTVLKRTSISYTGYSTGLTIKSSGNNVMKDALLCIADDLTNLLKSGYAE